jgi:tRNA (mo5U34)-methyltransferase
VITKGHKTAESLRHELATLQLPELKGKTVLDIGAWDGFYSFEAERAGAKRVLSLDHFVWGASWDYIQDYLPKCREERIQPLPLTHTAYWKPFELPGKKGYDTAHQALGSQVECLVADFMETDLGALGTFDVVLYLGVLYHMENLLAALKRVAAVTRQVAIIETEAVLVPGYEHHALCEFYEWDECEGDITNWWAPNLKALHDMCRAASFGRVETVLGPEDFALKDVQVLEGEPAESAGSQVFNVPHYRAIVHAWK